MCGVGGNKRPQVKNLMEVGSTHELVPGMCGQPERVGPLRRRERVCVFFGRRGVGSKRRREELRLQAGACRPRRGERSGAHRLGDGCNSLVIENGRRLGVRPRSRVNVALVTGTTAGRERTLKGVTAETVGKALETEIPGTAAARNKAARSGRDQTAESVRNAESGWRW